MPGREIVENVTIASQVEEWFDSITIPEFSPEDPAALSKYADFLMSVKDHDALFERGKGGISWVQGTVLNRIKPVDKSKSGIVKHGAWYPFLQQIGMDETTAYWCRRIAAEFPRQEARRLGYTSCVRQLCESFNTPQETTSAPRSPKKKRHPKLTENTIGGRLTRLHMGASTLKSELQEQFIHADDIDDKEALAMLEDADRIIEAIVADYEKMRNDIRKLKAEVSKVLMEKNRHETILTTTLCG